MSSDLRYGASQGRTCSQWLPQQCVWPPQNDACAEPPNWASCAPLGRRHRSGRMRLGYFTMPVHPMHRSWAETLKEDREAIILADKLGFHDAFMGEHLTDACENI